MNVDSSLEYIDKLPSPRVKRAAPDNIDSPPSEASAGVIDRQLIAFTSNLDTQFKEAVKYSTQMAQRAADSQFDLMTARLEWYETYGKALKHAGWIGTDNKLTRYQNSNLEVTMENVAIELVKLAAGPNATIIADLTSATINALKGDGEVLAKLQQSSSSGSSGSFDILPCLQKDDDVVMYNHAMVFETSTSSGGFWFWSWKMSEVSLKHAANEWTLNYSHYKTVEEKIKEKLGASSNNFFDALNLG